MNDTINYLSIANENIGVRIIDLRDTSTTPEQPQQLMSTPRTEQIEFLTDEEIQNGTFCQIYNYANPKVSLDISKLSFVIYYPKSTLLTENIEYKFVYTTDDDDNKFINVIYYKPELFQYWTQGTISCFINYEATLFSNVIADEDISKFVQSSSLIYEVPVSKPFYKSNSSITYIEDSLYNINNDKENYTYISKVLTNTGYNLYGVKRKEWFAVNSGALIADNELTKEKTNINASVVKLTPNTFQLQIYSFKNGPQYMELSNEALNKGLMNDGKLLPHYLQSYEYKIDGTIPENGNYNIKFYGSTGYVSSGNLSVPMCGLHEMFTELHSTITEEEEIDMLNGFLAYSFTVPYIINSNDAETTYGKVRNQNGTTKINSSDDVFENTYMPLTEYYSGIAQNVLQSYSDVLEVYERKITYTKISNSTLSANDINSGNYYKYDSKSSSYIVLTNVENTNKLEVFAKYISYNKISSNIKTHTTGNEFYDDTNVKKYIQMYEYTHVSDRENAIKSLFYVSKEIAPNYYAYYPLQAGIVNDGSIEYYGYTYVKLSNDKIMQYKGQTTDCPAIYVKQSYSLVTLDDLVNLSESDFNNLYVAENDIVYKELLSNSDTMFDVNINDNTIYAKKVINGDNEIIVPIDKSEFENIYYNNNDWFLQNKQKETSTNKLTNYSLPSKFNVVAKVHYEGKWNKLDVKHISNINETLSELSNRKKLFIKKESYNEITTNDLVSGYDIDFYVWGIGKIDALSITNVEDIFIDVTKYVTDTSQLTHPKYNINDQEIIYDENIWLDNIDNNGFANSLEYWTRKPIMTKTNDLYFFINKEYYTLQNNNTPKNGITPLLPIAYLGVKSDLGSTYSLMNYWSKVTDETTPVYTTYIKLRNDAAKLLVEQGKCQEISYTPNNENEKYDVNYSESSKISAQSTYYLRLNTYSGNKYIDINNIFAGTYNCYIDAKYESTYIFEWDKIKFYKDSISHYLISESNNLVTDIVDYDKKYIYSKFFYQDFTNNNGVHQAKDGSYYTTISIFDGTRGTISKSLFLQPNIFNVTEYTYNYVTDAFIEIDYDEDLSNIPQSEYSNYFWKNDNNEYVQLTPESQSPAYYQAYLASIDQQLYTYMTKEMVAIYDGRNVGPINNLQVQYFDNLTYEPKIIKKNDDLFGIIFNIDLTNDEQQILCSQNNMFLSPISGDFSFPYEYDIVKLKEYIIHNDNDEDFPIILQSQKTEYKNITTPTPFYLTNEKEAEFTGSYIWNLPKHSYVFAKQNDDYVAYDIIKEDGYWEREYNVKTVPLVVASYNFYSDPTKISNTTLSYTFTPDSKIITEIIEHPEIAYKSIVKESHEVARYKYIYKGIECDYPSTSYVQENNDGSYYGLIDIDGKQTLINLVKYIDVDFVNVLKDVIHQEHEITYEYSSYKTSIALTNEKVPVLYSTELIPATSHKILYWNEDVESYAIKTVVDSYAHYAYNYYYDVVPFVTTSYMRQDSDITISYIEDISGALTSLSNNISASVTEMSQSVSGVPSVLNELKDAITTFGNQNGEKLGYLESLSNNITEALNNLQTTTVSDGNGGSVSVNVNGITQSIDNQSNALSGYISALEPKLFDINKTIGDSMSNLKDDLVSSISDMFEYESESIAYILKEGFKKQGLPTYEEFMVELTKNMYAKIDFDKEIIDTEQKDENGNMVNKSKHKPNPTDLAQKTIYRADILWKELKKKNIVS